MGDERMRFDFTDEFLDALAEFAEAGRQGRPLSIDEHVARYPQFGPRLRELCETSDWLDRTFARFKQEYPQADLRRLLKLPRTR